MKDTNLHIRINTKTKKELQEIAAALDVKVAKIIDECIRKTIDKNYKLLKK